MEVKDCTLIKPLYCGEGTSVVEVAKMLRDNKQRRIIVVDGNKHPVGIISTTDMNNRVVAEGKDASKLKAKDIMTSPIFLVCDFNDSLNEIFNKMVQHESYFCPVIKANELYGILTYGEILDQLQKKMKNG